MNALTTPDLSSLEQLPLAAIRPSRTAVQARRRSRFTTAALAELAESIKALGILQPVIVRPVERDVMDGEASPTHEVVAGERRYLAAQVAGLSAVPAIVRDIADRDLVAFQLTENLNRDTLHPLDEAEGYRHMMQPAEEGGEGLTADQVAERIGCSRRQVYNRLKLLEVAPAVQDALDAGRLDQSKAILIACLPSQKLQRKALEKVNDYSGAPHSVRAFAELLRHEFMVDLRAVPFALDDAELTPGACTGCPYYSPNDPDLQAELEADDAGARICTNKPCHDRKVIQFFERRVLRAREAGRTVIEGDEAKALKPTKWGGLAGGYVDLDDDCHEMAMPKDLTEEQQDAWQPPSYRQALGLGAEEVPAQAVLLLDPHNKEPRDLLPAKELQKLLKARGIKYTVQRAEAPEAPEDLEARKREEEKQRAREEQERAFRLALAREIHAKWKGPLKKEDLVAIVETVMEGNGLADDMHDFWQVEIEPERLSERELGLLLVEICVLSPLLYRLGNAPTALLALAKKLRIDPAKVKKQVKAELEQAA